MEPTAPTPEKPAVPVREHVYDGIQEYDHRLPNWWLYTLYGGIAFWLLCWSAFLFLPGKSDAARVDDEMTKLAALKMASSIDISNDGKFWEMSVNPVFVDAGKQTYASLCVACHLPSMRGKAENPAAVGPDLTDTAWLHGGTPKEIYATVSKGVLTKGMPAWEPVLGQKKTAEVVAYLLAHHAKDEAIVPQASN